MQQIKKAYLPFKWMLVVLTSTTLLWSCGSGETKTNEVTGDTTTVNPAPKDSVVVPDSLHTADSLPPIDSSASTRPETRKAKK